MCNISIYDIIKAKRVTLSITGELQPYFMVEQFWELNAAGNFWTDTV